MPRTTGKKLCALIALLLIVCALPQLRVNADETSDVVQLQEPAITTQYAVVRSVRTGQLLYYSSEDALTKHIAPASTVKLMTALVAYEQLPDLTKVVAVSKTALEGVTGNNINLREGEELTVQNLLRAVLISCANDASNVLAEYAGDGSIAAFVELMNAKAKELGANNTVYTNPTGIDSPDMYTTAADTAIIAEAFYKTNALVAVADTNKYQLPPTNKTSGSRNLLNKNHLISTFVQSKYYYADAIGLNAGATEAAGQCLVTASDKDGLSYIYVLMGGTETKVNDTDTVISNYADAKTLINWTNTNFEYQTIEATSKILGEIEVDIGSGTDTVVVRPAKDIDIIIDKRQIIKFEYETDPKIEDIVLSAPVAKDQKVGIVNILLNGKVIATTDLVTMSAVERNEFQYIMMQIGAFFESKTLKVIIIIFVVLIALYITATVTLKVLEIVRKNKKRRERTQQMTVEHNKLKSDFRDNKPIIGNNDTEDEDDK